MKYAIKYQRIRYDELIDILIPKIIIKGEIEGDYFKTNNTIYPYITNECIDSKYVIGNATSLEEIKKLYNPEDYSEKEILEFFFMDHSDKLLILSDNKITSIDLYEMINDDTKKELYQNIDGEASIILNQAKITELIKLDDLAKIKEYLIHNCDKLSKFEKIRELEGINNFVLQDGKITELGINDIQIRLMKAKQEEKKQQINNSDFTLSGFYKYLKEHIIGHDKELKLIATILFLNYNSNPYYGTESILIPGPTGTGKTATFNCAANYFDVPFKIIDTSSLVSEGIEGTTIQDELSSIIDSCNDDMSRAEKSIIVFDEFDKIAKDNLDVKSSMMNEFLKVLEGATISINRQMRAPKTFNTTMSSKICLGAFSDAYKTDKILIGFDSKTPKQESFDRNLLITKGYFSNELLTRFQHIIPYKNLSDEDKIIIISFINKRYLLVIDIFFDINRQN